MAIYLDELQCGVDSTTLGFPHVLLCMAVVLQTRSFLYGMHFDTPSKTNEFANAFLDFIQRKGGDVANGVRLYGCCNRAKRHHITNHLKSTWRAEMTNIANILGYHGPVTGFDTEIIDPNNGTYIEFCRVPNQNTSEVFYKRHEKMAHTSITYGQAGNVAGPAQSGNMWTWKSNNYGPSGWVANRSMTQTATLAQGATKMHTLNYSHRADTFNV